MEKLRVFIVEDDPFYQRFLKELIESKYNAKVYVFDKGGDVLKNLKLKPHILFVDYHLSDNVSQFNGLELIELLNDAEVPMRKILLSGQASIEEMDKVKEFEFLEKSEKSLQDVMSKLEETILKEELKKDISGSFRKAIALSAVITTAVLGMLVYTL